MIRVRWYEWFLCKFGLWKVRSNRTRSRKNHSRSGNLVSGHTRMALGNTRMRCWYAYGGKPYAYGRKRWHFERKLVSGGTRKGRLLRVAYAYGIGDTRMSWARKCAIRVWEWAIRVWSWPGLGNTRMAWAVRVWAELGFSWTVVVQFLVV